MTSDTTVRARIPTQTKLTATVVLRGMGLTVSDAIRIMLTRVANEGKLPFSVNRDVGEAERPS